MSSTDIMELIKLTNCYIDDDVENNNVPPHIHIRFIRSLLSKYSNNHSIWNGPVKLLVKRLQVLKEVKYGIMIEKYKSSS